MSLYLQEKLYQWILRQQEGGSRVTTADILSYIQVSISSAYYYYYQGSIKLLLSWKFHREKILCLIGK